MKYIKIAIIVLVIILITILVLIFNLKNSAPIPQEEFEKGDEYIIEVDSAYSLVTNRNNYYVVEKCVNKFFEYYNVINDTENNYSIMDEAVEQAIKEEKQQSIDAIYSMLDAEYINDKGITKENIISKLNVKDNVQIDITDMYVAEQTETTYIYFVKGFTRDKTNNKLSEFSIMVKTDSNNKTFSIFLQDYINENYNNLKIGDTVKIKTENTIEKNYYNMYDYNNITDEIYITDLFNKFKEEIIYNSNLVYNNLNDEYKTKRFGTIEKFQAYTKNNIKKHVVMKITKYKKTKNDNITRYVCIDQNGEYYIFEETAVMKYKIILDTYTLDLPEFIEKYDSAKDEDKLQLNINKILEAINNQDYQYVYNKLDMTFKNNNFNNITLFENYIKNNFYEKSEITDFSYRQEGNVYICTIGISNKADSSQVQKNVTILIKLLENRDFDISFSL